MQSAEGAAGLGAPKRFPCFGRVLNKCKTLIVQPLGSPQPQCRRCAQCQAHSQEHHRARRKNLARNHCLFFILHLSSFHPSSLHLNFSSSVSHPSFFVLHPSSFITPSPIFATQPEPGMRQGKQRGQCVPSAPINPIKHGKVHYSLSSPLPAPLFNK